MKNRNGFVSNSSSSSFVICKEYLTDKQIEAIKQFRKDMIKADRGFGDNGNYLNEDDNYISFEIYYIDSEFCDMCDKNGIDTNKMFRI